MLQKRALLVTILFNIVSVAHAANIIQNPGFESGSSSWTQATTSIYRLIYGPADGFHLGNNSTYGFVFFSEDNLVAKVYQDVTIPASAATATLDFYYNISTKETTASSQNDYFLVLAAEPPTSTTATIITALSNLDKTGGVYKHSGIFDLSSYKGKTIRLQFGVVSDAANTTTFFIDDIYLDVTTAAAVNGTCGSANGTSVTTIPTTNLCSSGTPSSVTGSGPWNWSCNGSGGGTTANCSANVLTSPSTTPSINYYHQSDGTVAGLTTNGSTVTGGTQFYQEANAAWSIVGQGDFDGDGIRDLVWWNNRTGQVYIMLMSSPTAVKSGAVAYTEPNTYWRIVATGDLNGDSKTDLIWWNQLTGQVVAMLLNGTAVTGSSVIYTEPNTDWKIVAAADFNGNGKAELLWWNSSTGQAAIGQTNGTSASTASVIYTESNTSWRIAGAGDLDGDGKADIVWHNRKTGQVFGIQTNGSSVTNGAMLLTEPNTYWEIVSIGNYNSDSKAELLWWNQQTGQVYLMPMNGLSVAPGGALLYTEPDLTWKIQGETEWRDKLYGRGVTTTTK